MNPTLPKHLMTCPRSHRKSVVAKQRMALLGSLKSHLNILATLPPVLSRT